MTAMELNVNKNVLREKLSYYEKKNRKKAETLSRELKAINGYLVRSHVAKYIAKKRDESDRRRMVAWCCFAYYGSDGFEYRKSFVAPANTPETKFWNIAPEVISI